MSKNSSTRTLRCLTCLSSPPQATIRPGNSRSIVTRPFTSAATAHPVIPHVQRASQSDIPCAETLSRLNILGLWRTLKKSKETGDESSQQLTRRTRREKRLEGLSKKDDGGATTQVPVAEGGSGGGVSQEGSKQAGSENVEGGAWNDTSTSGGYDGGVVVGGDSGIGDCGGGGCVGGDGGGGA